MMFEAITARVARLAASRTVARRRDLAERLAEALPAGVHAESDEAGVLLSGRNLRRRIMLDSGLNWLIAGLIK